LDEHGRIEDKRGLHRLNEKLKLVSGHCDPTCNLHDWYVCVRNGEMEVVSPVSACAWNELLTSSPGRKSRGR
jgi:3-hydroxy-D-aspartate aldolase